MIAYIINCILLRVSFQLFNGLPKIHKSNNGHYVLLFHALGLFRTSLHVALLIMEVSSSSQDFVDKVKNIVVDSSEILISYNVSALFTSIPVDRESEVVKHLLINDNSKKQRTYLSVSHVLPLLQVCLHTTFSFRGELYHQDGGCAMSSSVSPTI